MSPNFSLGPPKSQGVLKCALVWVCPKAESETRTWPQVVSGGWFPGGRSEGVGNSDCTRGEAGHGLHGWAGHLLAPDPAPRGPSASPRRVCLRVGHLFPAPQCISSSTSCCTCTSWGKTLQQGGRATPDTLDVGGWQLAYLSIIAALRPGARGCRAADL